jgi:alpha-L-fucosidase
MTDVGGVDVQQMMARPVPAWYSEARFGIFVHWGPFTVPAWAPVGPDPFALAEEHGWDYAMVNTPYAEWYWNSISIDGSPAQQHHAETYGDLEYGAFVEEFQQTSQAFDAATWAALFAESGARYVVLTTKHHDGYLLWPSDARNPNRKDWQSERDLVGELTDAVRDAGMKMGLYYSGGLDWTFGGLPMADFMGMIQAIPRTPEYAEYLAAHWRELIARYAPSVIWNDIHHPPGADDAHKLFAHYYDAVPDGVVNDRFDVPGTRAGTTHADFTTPEFSTLETISERPWETCRGIGSGFGYNANEPDSQLMSVDDIVHLLVDIVSKNGNLLLNVGPMKDGTIPPAQANRLRGVGAWLDLNGEAIYGSRPWRTHAAVTASGKQVRFTTSDDALYAIVLGFAVGETVTIEGLNLDSQSTVELLGDPDPLHFEPEGGGTTFHLPEQLPTAPAYTLRITPKP